MTGADRVRVPAVLSREPTMWLSVGAGVVGVFAVLGWMGATQPANRPFVGAAAVLLALGGVALLGRRTRLDRSRGTVAREVCFVPRAPVAWADATKVAFTNNGAGQLHLEVRGAGRSTSLFIPLVAVDVGGDRSQEPEFLRVLADEVEKWAPQRPAVVRELRGQADHLAAGGEVRASPLAQRLAARR